MQDLSIRRKKKRRRKNLRRRQKARERYVEQINRKGKKRKTIPGGEIPLINLPDHLNVTDGEQRFLKQLNKADGYPRVRLCFRQTKSITISAGLYLRAFYDHLVEEGKKPKIVCPTENGKIREILQHIGVANYRLSVCTEDVVCWEIMYWDLDTNPPNFARVLMEEVLPRILKDKRPSEDFNQIASALQEVLTNCVEHAYEKSDRYKKYYLIAGEYPQSNLFAFTVIDRGIGFKKSLEQQKLKVRQRISNSDGQLIKAAVRGQSGAGKAAEGRGAGLRSVREKIKSMEGELRIISGRGLYTTDRSGNETYRDSGKKSYIKGALITMFLPINEKNV